MPDGYLYFNILMKLYLRSLKFSGKLMFNEKIPYNSTILAQITRHPVGVVEKALSIFKELGLIDILDTGAIYMLDIQNFIGKSSTEADRKRDYRIKIENEKYGTKGHLSGHLSDKNPPEIELETEIEKETEIEEQLSTTKQKNVKKCEQLVNKSEIDFSFLKKVFSSEIVEKTKEALKDKDFSSVKNIDGYAFSVARKIKENLEDEEKYKKLAGGNDESYRAFVKANFSFINIEKIINTCGIDTKTQSGKFKLLLKLKENINNLDMRKKD